MIRNQQYSVTNLKKDRVYELDVMRFGAALSVLMYHYIMGSKLFPGMSIIGRYGFLGVNLFFMISGFVIILSAYDSKPSDFVISRIARLYPAYWISVTLTVVLVILIKGNTSGITLHQYLMNLSMINNYFKVEDIDGVYWTLQTELKFYFLIFMLIATKYIRKIHVWLTIWLFLVILYRFFKQPFFLGWLITPFYSSYFIAGIAFFMIRTEGISLYSVMVLLSSIVVSVSYSSSQIEGFIKNPTEMDRIIAAGLILMIYVLFFVVSLRKINFRYSKLFFILGALTYPLYLIHFRIGFAIFEFVQMNKYLLLALLTLSMLAASFFISYFMEKRMMTWLKEFCFSIRNSCLKRLSFLSEKS